MPWNTAAESTNLTECSTTDFISPQSKTPHPQILIFSSFSNSKCFFFLNILPLYLEMIIVAYFTKSLEINQKFLNLQLPNVRAYIHRCSHSVVHMANVSHKSQPLNNCFKSSSNFHIHYSHLFSLAQQDTKQIYLSKLSKPQAKHSPSSSLYSSFHHSYGRGQRTIHPTAPHNSLLTFAFHPHC